MGRGDEQKNCNVLYLMVINTDFTSSDMPPLPNNIPSVDVLDVCMLVKHIIVCWDLYWWSRLDISKLKQDGRDGQNHQ